MSTRSGRYERLNKAFSVIGDIHEVRLAQAQKRRAEIVRDISGILKALRSPLLGELALHASAIRRLAGLEEKGRCNDSLIAETQNAMISARSKGKHSKELAGELRIAEDRAAEEAQSLEISALMMNSRPRQAGDA